MFDYPISNSGCWSEDPKLRPSFDIIRMTMSAIISSSRKKGTSKRLRGPLLLKQAVYTSGAESSSTLSTLDYLYDDEEEARIEEEDFDFDELATLEC